MSFLNFPVDPCDLPERSPLATPEIPSPDPSPSPSPSPALVQVTLVRLASTSAQASRSRPPFALDSGPAHARFAIGLDISLFGGKPCCTDSKPPAPCVELPAPASVRTAHSAKPHLHRVSGPRSLTLGAKPSAQFSHTSPHGHLAPELPRTATCLGAAWGATIHLPPPCVLPTQLGAILTMYAALVGPHGIQVQTPGYSIYNTCLSRNGPARRLPPLRTYTRPSPAGTVSCTKGARYREKEIKIGLDKIHNTKYQHRTDSKVAKKDTREKNTIKSTQTKTQTNIFNTSYTSNSCNNHSFTHF